MYTFTCSMRVWTKMLALSSPDQGLRVGTGHRGSPEKLMSSRVEMWKELTRGKELPAKDAHVSETQRLQLLPRNGKKSRMTRAQEDCGKNMRVGDSGRDFRQLFHWAESEWSYSSKNTQPKTQSRLKSQILSASPLPGEKDQNWVLSCYQR